MAKTGTAARGRGSDTRGSRVYEALMERIRSRELQPGQRIREEEVAAMLGVSRTPVREALTRLQARGLVVSSPNGLSLAEFSRPQIMELYALRAALEGASARFAAENATGHDLAELELMCRRFGALEGGPDDFARANRRLHEAILEAAHNRYLSRMLEELHDSLALLPDTTFSQPGRSEAARGEHERILEGIRRRQPDEAERAAREHIERARDTRLAMLFETLR